MMMKWVMTGLALPLFLVSLTGCGVPQEAPAPLPRATSVAALAALEAPAIFLDLGAQGTNALSSGMESYDRVAKLSLRAMPLTSLPNLLAQCPALVWLDAAECGLTTLDSAMHALSSVQTLYLSDNKLTGLPAQFALLPALRYLNLDRNGLTTLPQSMASLVELRRVLETTDLPKFENGATQELRGAALGIVQGLLEEVLAGKNLDQRSQILREYVGEVHR